MRSSVRSVLVALVAVLALGAVAASGASAHQWEVKSGGVWKALGAGESRSVKFTEGSRVFQVNGVEVSCSSAEGKGSINGEGAGEVLENKYTGCTVQSPNSCGYIASIGEPNGTLLETNLPTRLFDKEGLAYDEVEQNVRAKDFVKFEMATTEGGLPCGALAIANKITGSYVGKVNSLAQSLDFNGQSGEKQLKWNAWNFEYAGTTTMVLVSGEGEGWRAS